MSELSETLKTLQSMGFNNLIKQPYDRQLSRIPSDHLEKLKTLRTKEEFINFLKKPYDGAIMRFIDGEKKINIEYDSRYVWKKKRPREMHMINYDLWWKPYVVAYFKDDKLVKYFVNSNTKYHPKIKIIKPSRPIDAFKKVNSYDEILDPLYCL